MRNIFDIDPELSQNLLIAGEAVKGQPIHEAMKTAGMDFTVEKRPIYQMIGDKSQAIKGHYVVVRTDNDIPLGVVGESYTPFQNKQLADFLDLFFQSSGTVLESAGLINDGACVWAMAKGQTKEVVPTDKYEEIFLIRNSFDGSSSLNINFMIKRTICHNILQLPFKSHPSHFSVPHTPNINANFRAIENLLALQIDNSRSTYSALSCMAKFKLSDKALKDLTARLISSQRETFGEDGEDGEDDLFRNSKTEAMEKKVAFKKITELAQIGKGVSIAGVQGTLYCWVHAVAEYVDHYRELRPKKRALADAHFESILFGSGAQIKTDAFNLAKSLL
jgi:phage/plasmid-like protein (TIGR03299 family)